MAFKVVNDRFNSNLLALNTDKTYFMQYSTRNNSLANLNITYDNNMMLLSIKIDNTLSRKSHMYLNSVQDALQLEWLSH